MAEQLDWVFEGVDHFSGPVGGMASSLGQFALGLNSATELVMKLGEGLSFLAEKAIDFTKFGLDAIAFKESTLVGFETLLKSREEAKALFKQAQTVADLSPFETTTVVKSYQKLLGAHFSKEEVPIVFAAIGDAASFAGTKAEMNQVVDSVARAMSRMMSHPQADLRHLQEMSADTNGIVSITAIAAAVGKRMGDTQEVAMGKLSSGAYTSRMAVQGVVDVMAELGGGKVGGSLLKNAGTIKGLLSTFASLKENFFFAMGEDSETSSIKGINDFKSALGNIIDYFNVAGDTGKGVAHALEQVFGGLLNAVFGPLAGPEGPKVIGDTMKPILAWVEGVDWSGVFGTIKTVIVDVGKVVGSVFSGVWDVLQPVFAVIGDLFSSFGGSGAKGAVGTLQMLGKVLGWVAGAMLVTTAAMALIASPIILAVGALVGFGAAMAQLWDAPWGQLWEDIKGVWETADKFWTDLEERFVVWGANLIDGLIQGIKSKASSVWDAMKSLAGGTSDAFTEPNEIKSPSGLFEDYGGYLAEGLVQGIEGGTGDVTSAIAAMGQGVSSAGSSAGGQGGGMTFTFAEGAFQVDARGADGEKLARELSDMMATSIAQAFEGMAIEAGT